MTPSHNCRNLPPLAGIAIHSHATGCAGKHERFHDVVLPHLADARRLARRVTRDHADADDVMQEAAVRLLRFVGSYRGGDALSWVLQVTRNTALSWMRQNRRHHLRSVLEEQSEEEDWPPPLYDRSEDPFVIEARRGESVWLARAIRELPPNQREIVILRDLHDLPYAEIASVLGIPIGTVMSRLSRTREALKQRLTHLDPTQVVTT
jgi:RNA polymerase sigma-70 factor, ECF subfamily